MKTENDTKEKKSQSLGYRCRNCVFCEAAKTTNIKTEYNIPLIYCSYYKIHKGDVIRADLMPCFKKTED